MNDNFFNSHSSFTPSNSNHDYQETISEEHLAGDDRFPSQRWFSNPLRREGSRSSVEGRPTIPNNNQTSISQHRSQSRRRSVANDSDWPTSSFSSTSSTSRPSQPPTGSSSTPSYQNQDPRQAGTLDPHVSIDSLSYEDLTAMLNSGWEHPISFSGETLEGSGHDTIDALDFNPLPRSNQRTPPPVIESSSDLVSPSRVIRNPRDLTSPRPASVHDPFAISAFSRLDFDDQNQGRESFSGHRSIELEQSRNCQDDLFGEPALSSSWAGPSISGSGVGGQWGTFRDRSFSTSNSEADMDWDADVSLDDNQSASSAVSLSPSSITGVMTGTSDFLAPYSPNDMMANPSRLHRLPEEESSPAAGSSSQGHSHSFRSPSSLSPRSNRGLGGATLSGSNRPLSPSQQLQMSVSSLESPSTRRRGAVSPTNTSSSSVVGQRRRSTARSTGALRSGPGPIRPSTAGGHSAPAFRNRAGTVSQIYMSSSSSTATSKSPYPQPSSSSLDEAHNFSRPHRRPSSRASMGDAVQEQVRERPRSQIQSSYDAHTQLPGEGGLPASLSSELASLGLDPSQLGDEDGDISMLLANPSRPQSMPMLQSSSGSGSGSGGQQKIGEGWEDNSIVSISNTSSLDATAQDDSLLSSRVGSNSFGPRGADTPLSSPASSPFHSRETSFLSMHPSAREVANLREVSEFGEMQESLMDSVSDRSSTWPRVRASGPSQSNSLQAPPMHQSRSSNAVQMLSPSSSSQSRQKSSGNQRRLSKNATSIHPSTEMDSNHSRQGSTGHHQGRHPSSFAVEPRNSSIESNSNSSRWSLLEAASSASVAGKGRSGASQGRASSKQDGGRINESSSSSSNDYRSPIHEVLASPNAAQVIEEVAKRERNSRVKYNEVSAALDTLRLFLKQREDNVNIGSLPGLSSSSSSSISSGKLRPAPSTGEMSVASTSASAGSSSRSTPARTLRHLRGPLPPRGSVASSSSSSHTQVGGTSHSAARVSSSGSHISVVDDISERVTRMRQRSEQFSQHNLRDSYRASDTSNVQQQNENQNQHQGRQ